MPSSILPTRYGREDDPSSNAICFWKSALSSENTNVCSYDISNAFNLDLGIWIFSGCWMLVVPGQLYFVRAIPPKNSLTECHDHLAPRFALASVSGRFGISPGRYPSWNLVCRHSPGSIAGAAPGPLT